MRNQPSVLNEQELADNQLYFQKLYRNMLFFILIPLIAHIGFLLAAPNLLKDFWQYTCAPLVSGGLVTCYLLAAKNRCPVCQISFQRRLITQRHPICPRCGSKIV